MVKAAFITVIVLGFIASAGCFTVFILRDSLPFLFIGFVAFAFTCMWFHNATVYFDRSENRTNEKSY